MRLVEKYYHDSQDLGISFECPFDGEVLHECLIEEGGLVALGVITEDPEAQEPLAQYGAVFGQWRSRRHNHYIDREDVQVLKGRTFAVKYRTSAGGYYPEGEAIVHADQFVDSDIDGFITVPGDVVEPFIYAAGVLNDYNAWISGDSWGICVWTFYQDGKLYCREYEVWGYFGYDDTAEELRRLFNNTVDFLRK